LKHQLLVRISNNIKIIIEPIDFNIGLKNYNYKSFNAYLRRKRTYDLTKDVEKYDYIISCRNDIIFNNFIDINKIKNNFYNIIGNLKINGRKNGGFPGYADADFDICFLFNRINYKAFNNCINNMFIFNEKDNIFYLKKNINFVSPIFDSSLVPCSRRDISYYNNLINSFKNEIKNPNNTVTRSCGMGEIFTNFLTHFLSQIDSKWDLYHFNNVNCKILFPETEKWYIEDLKKFLNN